MNAGFSEIPQGLLIPLIVIAVIQIVVEIFALITLFRTPDDRLVFGKKWPWILIILFVNLVGGIVFLAAGRKPAPAADPLAGTVGPGTSDRAARAADVLYGHQDGDRS